MTDITLDHISPSSISTYLDSPLRWYDHYVRGIRDDNSFALHRGIVVHETLEQRIHRDTVAAKFMPDEVQAMADWDWDKALRLNDESRRYEYPLDEELDFDATASLVETYWNKYGSRLSIDESEWPFRLELPYAERLKFLVGRCDVVHTLNGQPAIIDFKTGGRKRSLNDVKNDPQAIIYGIAARDLLGVEGTVHFSYHQLIFKTIPEIAILDRPVTPAEMREFEEDFLPPFIKTLEWQIETDNFFFNPNARFGKRAA